MTIPPEYIVISILEKKNVYTKDEDIYEGPCEIIEKRYDRSYTIKMRNGKIMTKNVEWLRKYKLSEI